MPTPEYRAAHRDQLAQAQRTYRASPAGQAARQAERKKYRKTPHGRAVRNGSRKQGHITKHTFLAIDGEGATIDGNHAYTMIATSEPGRSLFTGQALSSWECLRFIANIPRVKGRYVVSFFFDYDVTMILRDFAKAEPAMAEKLFTPGTNSYVWWRGFGLKYTAHKSLTVKRYTKDNSSHAVVIHDTQGFFQSSFVAALEKLDVGTADERADILAMKEQRGTFTWADSPAVLAYSQHECALLVSLMEKVRDLAALAGVNAEPYEGPGAMARRSLEQHYGKPAHDETVALMQRDYLLMWAVSGSMYGGRFEIGAVGPIDGPVREYDRKSAYPYAMSQLECLRHGKWIRSKGHPGCLRLSLISFDHDAEPSFGGYYTLPVRKKTGELHYPKTGEGYYWEEEYNVPGITVKVKQSFVFKPSGCDCKPFAWVADMFNQRLTMEAEHKGSGICLKLVLNTLYGKMAQQKPLPGSFLNMAYASLITMRTRKYMLSLARQLPERAVVMFATDAIFVRAPYVLPETSGLGGLELAGTYENMTIVQPGMYFDGDSAHFKTRGVPKKYIRENMAAIRTAVAKGETYSFDVEQFRGMRWCLATGRHQDMGQWITHPRKMKSDGETKRTRRRRIDGATYTLPAPNVNFEGISVRRDIDTTEPDRQRHTTDVDIQREWHDFTSEAPDATDLS